jgi:maltose/maltodextrin transport system substrate-binding protein
MKTTLQRLSAASTGALLTLALSAGAAHAAQPGELIIWMGGDKAYRGMTEIGKRFTEDTGIPVKVEYPEDVTGKFQQAAASGKGPDIFFWAHDRLGEWVAGGLVKPVTPSDAIREDIDATGWDAFTVNNRIYGYPVSFEAVGLIYNKDLVPEPPQSFDEVIEIHERLQQQGKSAILWDYNNTYFSWPLLAANGGYVFAETENGYDTSDTGVANAGAQAGVETIMRLIEAGVMPRGASYADMEAGVNQGRIAMMINGPWSWSNLEKSGIDFGVAPIPAIDGEFGKPFVGVWGAMISAASPNEDLATLFLEEYVLVNEGLETLNQDVSLGTPASQSFYQQVADNPKIAATMKNVQLGEPMPNVPAMGRFWSAMESALQNITSGRQSVEEGLEAAAARIQAQ